MSEGSRRLKCAIHAIIASVALVGCTRDEPSDPVAAPAPSATQPGSDAPSVAPSMAEREELVARDQAIGAGSPGDGAIESGAEYLDDPELAGADLERGKLLSLACAACHTFGAGERVIIGPNLHGIFGRRAASLPDFAYSPALRASGLYWTPRTVAAWLADPQGFVSGTTMTFTGYRSAEDRRDLIAYLLRATE
jgi:cytochrome c